MEEERCNTRLALGIGGDVDIFAPSNRRRGRQRKPPVQFDILFPPCAREEEEVEETGWQQLVGEEPGVNRSRLRTPEPEEREGAVDRGSSGEGGGPRKKLRLTKGQSALLESTFREHNILTPAQKQELADKLNLRSRQVEVWFQNRRARTKLKQTEVDCDFLKKCCETLSDENARLKKELQELQTSRHAGGSPFYVQLPRAATLTVCPSCEKIAAGGGNKGAGLEAAVVVGAAAAKRGFYDHTTVKDSSMAC